MATQIATAYVQIIPSAEGISGALGKELGGSLDGATKSAGGLGSALGKIGSVGGMALGAVATAGAAATAAIIAGTKGVAEYGDNIDKMSQKMGISAQAYQEWDHIMQHSGTSMESLKSGMKTLANAVESGNGAFERIGMTQEQIASMSQEDLFAATIAGLQNVSNETERTYLAGQLLGRGATELGPLLNMSAEETEEMRQRLHELGGVMSDDAVKASAQFQDSMQDMKTAMKGLSRGMLTSFLPSITSIMDGLTEVFSGNAGAGKAKISAGVKTMMSGILDAIPGIFESGQAIGSALLEAIVESLPQLAMAGVQIISSLATSIIQAVPQLLAKIPELFSALVDGFSANTQAMQEGGSTIMGAFSDGIGGKFPEIISSILEKVPEFLAAGGELVIGMITGFLESVPNLIAAASELLTAVLGAFLENLPEFMSTGLELLLSLVQGILQSLPDIIAAAVELVASLVGEFLNHLPELLETGLTLLGELIAGLIKAIPDLIDAAGQIVETIWDKITNTDWLALGKAILDGIIAGIGKFAGSVGEAIGGVVGGIKERFSKDAEINSPSKLFMRLAESIPEGIALGIRNGTGDAMGAIDDMVGAAEMRFGAMQMNANMAPAGGVESRMDEFLDRLENLTINNNIRLEGDARGLFKAVRSTNYKLSKATGSNMLAGGY